MSKKIELLGQKIGRLEVIESLGIKDGKYLWKCKCDCGKELILPTRNLRNNRKESCSNSCTRRFQTNAKIVGQRYGKIVVISYSHKKGINHFYKIKCDCGREDTMRVGGIGKYTHCRNCKNFKGYEDISGHYISSVKCGAKKRRIEFNIELPYLWNLFINQNKKCFLSGRDISFSKSSKLKQQTASLDRIDSNKGYVKGNVQWVHKDFNNMKNSWSQEDFIDMCREVVVHFS